MGDLFKLITINISTGVAALAALIIAVAAAQVCYNYSMNLLSPANFKSNQEIRIKFGSYASVSLELLLGADILSTAVAPSWDDLGKLAAIAVIRTGLNFFLERELKNAAVKEN